jgi:hypothetical protein
MTKIGMLGDWDGAQYVATKKSVQEGKFWASKPQTIVGSERLKPMLAIVGHSGEGSGHWSIECGNRIRR